MILFEPIKEVAGQTLDYFVLYKNNRVAALKRKKKKISQEGYMN